jgi:hypothetical protein
VAGTGGPRGALSPFGEEVNDGVVALQETYMTETDAVLQVPAWHTFMMNHPQVRRIIMDRILNSALKNGKAAARSSEISLRG